MNISAAEFIYIVSDDAAGRQSASSILKSAKYRVATYISGRRFLNELAYVDRSCALLDVRFSGMDCCEVQQEMSQRGIDMPVVIVANHGAVKLAVWAMKAGAVTVVGRPYDDVELLAAIVQAFAKFGGSFKWNKRHEDAKIRLAGLTRRERDVLNGLIDGYPSKTIAYHLGISPRTVEIHRANMMEKLRARSLSEALHIAFWAEEPATNIVASQLTLPLSD